MSSESRNDDIWFEDPVGRCVALLRDSGVRAHENWSEELHADECGLSSKDFDVPFSTVLRKALGDFPSIDIDSDVLCGTPRIAGTRIPVYMILDAVQHYGTVQGALTSYSHLTEHQVKEALMFAAAVLEHPFEHELEGSTG